MDSDAFKRNSTPNARLKYEREKRGWSQGDAADKLYNLCVGEELDKYGFVDSKRISAWERGINKPDRFWQRKLCELYGKSLEELGIIQPPDEDLRETSRIDGMPINAAYSNYTVISSRPQLGQGNVVDRDGLISTDDGNNLRDPSTNVVEGERNASSLQSARPQIVIVSSVAQPSTLQGDDMDRRHAMSAMASVPLGLAGLGSLLHNEEMLSIYAASIPIYWRLYFDGFIAEIDGVLPVCLLHLSALASKPSFHQQQAASLASKASQLACMLALQDQKFGNALIYARQGFQYGQVAEDPNLQTASLVRKALVYFYMKKPEQKLQIYKEALRYEAQVSPLMRARIYMGLSEAHSNLVALGDVEQEQGARRFLDLSYKTIPSSPKEDPNFSYTRFGLPKGYESLLYLDLQQPQKAWDLLAAQSNIMPMAITPDRVTLMIRQTKALIALGALEESCAYLEASITASRALKSKLRVEETYDVYQQLVAKWPQERYAKNLADLFLA